VEKRLNGRLERFISQKERILRIIRLKDVIKATGLARSTIYKLIGTGEFPPPVPITQRSVGWIESEVGAWIRTRVALRDATSTTCAVCGRKGNGD
jgi:prophage regulatory protein